MKATTVWRVSALFFMRPWSSQESLSWGQCIWERRTDRVWEPSERPQQPVFCLLGCRHVHSLECSFEPLMSCLWANEVLPWTVLPCSRWANLLGCARGVDNYIRDSGQELSCLCLLLGYDSRTAANRSSHLIQLLPIMWPQQSSTLSLAPLYLSMLLHRMPCGIRVFDIK